MYSSRDREREGGRERRSHSLQCSNLIISSLVSSSVSSPSSFSTLQRYVPSSSAVTDDIFSVSHVRVNLEVREGGGREGGREGCNSQ